MVYDTLINAIMGDQSSITRDELTKKLMNMCTNMDINLSADNGMYVRMNMQLIIPASYESLYGYSTQDIYKSSCQTKPPAGPTGKMTEKEPESMTTKEFKKQFPTLYDKAMKAAPPKLKDVVPPEKIEYDSVGESIMAQKKSEFEATQFKKGPYSINEVKKLYDFDQPKPKENIYNDAATSPQDFINYVLEKDKKAPEPQGPDTNRFSGFLKNCKEIDD